MAASGRASGTVLHPARWSTLIVLAAGVFAWWGTWMGQYLFDDHPAIEHNVALLAGDWWQAAFGPQHQPLSNRPFSTLSLVVDFALFGAGPFAPHLGNLLLHLGNGVLLMALIRRVLRAPNLGGRFDERQATWLATAIALLWVVHPLGADAVAYATQRSTVLFSGCLLLSLYATVRAHDSTRSAAWRALAVFAMALSMASKEDAIVGPILLVLFERAFLLPNWPALRRRLGYYLAVASTWLVLWLCVANGPANGTVGYDTALRVSALDWLCTQASVVVHYPRLTLWPWPLRGAYDWDYVRELGPALLPGLLVLTVLLISQLQWRRRPWWAWLGLLYFLLLAPTSTILPIVSEVVAERRAYLPMLLLLVAVVLGANRLLAGVLPATARCLLTIGVAVGLGFVSSQRVAVYHDEASFWADAFAKRTPASTSHLAAQVLGNHGTMLWYAGRREEAGRLFAEMMQCDAPTEAQRVQHSISRMADHPQETVRILDDVIAGNRNYAEAHALLGIALIQIVGAERRPDYRKDPRLVRAEVALRRAVELQPTRSDAWNALGVLLSAQQRWQQSEGAFAMVTQLTTERVAPFVKRASLLRRLGRKQEIGPLFERLLQDPRHKDQRAELQRRAEQLMR